MNSAEPLRRWVHGYLLAWLTNDPAHVAPLFAEDARYLTGARKEPWVGRDAIVANWLEFRDEPGNATFVTEHLSFADGLGCVEASTVYVDPPTVYRNVWLVHLDPEGRCTDFTEWWAERGT